MHQKFEWQWQLNVNNIQHTHNNFKCRSLKIGCTQWNKMSRTRTVSSTLWLACLVSHFFSTGECIKHCSMQHESHIMNTKIVLTNIELWNADMAPAHKNYRFIFNESFFKVNFGNCSQTFETLIESGTWIRRRGRCCCRCRCCWCKLKRTPVFWQIYFNFTHFIHASTIFEPEYMHDNKLSTSYIITYVCKQNFGRWKVQLIVCKFKLH